MQSVRQLLNNPSKTAIFVLIGVLVVLGLLMLYVDKPSKKEIDAFKSYRMGVFKEFLNVDPESDVQLFARYPTAKNLSELVAKLDEKNSQCFRQLEMLQNYKSDYKQFKLINDQLKYGMYMRCSAISDLSLAAKSTNEDLQKNGIEKYVKQNMKADNVVSNTSCLILKLDYDDTQCEPLR